MAEKSQMAEAQGIEYLDFTPNDTSEIDNDYNTIRSLYNYNSQRAEFFREYNARKNANGQIIDLMAIPNADSEIVKMISQLEKSLTNIQSVLAKKTVVINAKGYEFPKLNNLSEEEIQGVQKDVENFIQALSAIETLRAGGQLSMVHESNWNKIVTSLFSSRKGSAFTEILSGNGNLKNTETYLKRIFQNGSVLGKNLGYVMEDLIAQMLMSPEVKNMVAKEAGLTIKRVIPKITGALVGTIRTSITTEEIDNFIRENKTTTRGKPLRDAYMTYAMAPDGKNGTITADLDRLKAGTGISIRRYNLANKFHNNGISIGTLAVKNFRESLEFRIGGRDYSFLMYRAIAHNGNGFENGVAWFLARDEIDQIYFGQKKAGYENTFPELQDTSNLMIVNGKMMSTKTFLGVSEPNIGISGLPSYNGQFVAPASVNSFINDIHKSRMHIYAQISDISKFGFTK